MAKVALVTGATTGIGYEFCQLLSAEGYSLILNARNQDVLESQADELRKRSISVNVIAQDLSVPGACERILAQLKTFNLEPDVLINNAGFGSFGAFAETSLDLESRLLQVNVVAVTQLTKLLLPAMVKRGSGKILNVGSLAGFLPGPFMSVYFASKAYVLSFSEALANELRGSGITVTVLCPGATGQTAFNARAGMPESKKILSNVKLITAAAVARAGYQGMLNGDVLVIPGPMNKALALASRLMPLGAAAELARRLQPKME